MKYLAALSSVVLGAFAQYLFKIGVEQLKTHAQNMWLAGIKNISLWTGIACYGISVLIWFYVLSRMELSKAYPLISGGYIITAILGVCFLNESLSFYKIAGLFLILAGIILITKS